MQECARRSTFQGETAKHERSSGESEVLPFGITILSDRLKGLHPSQRTVGNGQLGKVGFQKGARSPKSARTVRASNKSGPHRTLTEANDRGQANSRGQDFCDVIVLTIPRNPPRSQLNGAPN